MLLISLVVIIYQLKKLQKHHGQQLKGLIMLTLDTDTGGAHCIYA